MIQRFLRFLLPREDHFYDFLEKQGAVAHEAALAMLDFKNGAKAVVIRDRVQDIEHQGDQLVHELLNSLSQTFVTPIDREDLQRLAKRLDDILDMTNAAARACVLFGVETPTQPMLTMIESLVAATSVIQKLLPKLRTKSYRDIIAQGPAVSQIEKQCDTIYRSELSRLFHDPSIDAKTIMREREVLEDLEKAINRCDQAAEMILDLAVKQS
jgi:uncharacterized protein Yka (UPF0111/DUF47 family)